MQMNYTHSVQLFCEFKQSSWLLFHTSHTDLVDLPPLCYSVVTLCLVDMPTLCVRLSLTLLFSGHTLLHTVGEHSKEGHCDIAQCVTSQKANVVERFISPYLEIILEALLAEVLPHMRRQDFLTMGDNNHCHLIFAQSVAQSVLSHL